MFSFKWNYKLTIYCNNFNDALFGVFPKLIELTKLPKYQEIEIDLEDGSPGTLYIWKPGAEINDNQLKAFYNKAGDLIWEKMKTNFNDHFNSFVPTLNFLEEKNYVNNFKKKFSIKDYALL